MISNWSKQNFIPDLEYVKDGENKYVDKRGQISNHELTEPINLIGLIDSKKGTMRANHYHPQQEQKCLFYEGTDNRSISRFIESILIHQRLHKL